MNQYVFCRNNPLSFIDPLGLAVRNVKYDGKTVGVDDGQFTSKDLVEEIERHKNAIRDLNRVMNMEATFMECGLGPVANAATGADPRYGTKGQQYLRSLYEEHYKLKGSGILEGAGNLLFSSGRKQSIYKQEHWSPGMGRQAGINKDRLQHLIGFLQAVQQSTR